MANNEDPDDTAFGSISTVSALFAEHCHVAGYINLYLLMIHKYLKFEDGITSIADNTNRWRREK